MTAIFKFRTGNILFVLALGVHLLASCERRDFMNDNKMDEYVVNLIVSALLGGRDEETDDILREEHKNAVDNILKDT